MDQKESTIFENYTALKILLKILIIYSYRFLNYTQNKKIDFNVFRKNDRFSLILFLFFSIIKKSTRHFITLTPQSTN